MFAEIVFKFIAAGFTFKDGLAKQVADGDMLEVTGFDFDLAVGRVGVNSGDDCSVFSNISIAVIKYRKMSVIIPYPCSVVN